MSDSLGRLYVRGLFSRLSLSLSKTGRRTDHTRLLRRKAIRWLFAGTGVVVTLAACGESEKSVEQTPSGTPAAEATASSPILGVAPQDGQWRRLAPLPSERSEVVAVALDGKVYVIGGLTPGGGTTDRVEAYDPGTDSWDEKAPLPKALHHSGATALGGKIYVAGGFVKTGFAPVADVFVYDPSADSWSAGPPPWTA